MPSYDKSLTRLILTYPPKQWECGGRSGPRAGIAMSAPWVRDWLIATWKAINVVVTDCKWDNKKLVSWNAAILSFSSNSRYDVGRSWSMDFAEVAHKSCSWIWSSGIAGFVVGMTGLLLKITFCFVSRRSNLSIKKVQTSLHIGWALFCQVYQSRNKQKQRCSILND